MNDKLSRIAERRRQLVAQSAAQRIGIADSIDTWRAPLALADRAVSLLYAVRRHPVFFSAITIAFTLLPQGRLAIWLRRGWLGAQIGYALLAKPGATTRREPVSGNKR